MSTGTDLPVDGDGVCMVCKQKPSVEDTLTCNTCVTPWHVPCLSVPPPTMSDAASWGCPDCSLVDAKPVSAANTENAGLIASIREIEDDSSLTDQEKAKRRQELLSGGKTSESPEDSFPQRKSEVLDLLDEKLYCSICMHLPDRPVTTPCGHNFCLKCFQKWVAQGKQSCANCRNAIPQKMAREPRINSALVMAIRTAKLMNSNASGGPPKAVHFIHNQNRPDKAFITERAKKSGKANACSGKIFVTIPHDHFGPILPENDPGRNQGVLVGETWEDRMECRQWGAHFPHVAGIAGQSDYGAQSVALSGGYEDDEDHGEWFLYTGSGGRDLSGNKRTNKHQSFEQKFEKYNEALRVSCRKGYPVRVVRSHKEKHSSYAPEKGVRYDGVYRIEQCWRKAGKQGFLMCRYLFVRCDNEPAPWTSDTVGDRPRPLPVLKELKDAVNITQRKESPAWDFDEEKGCWMWKKPPPESRVQVDADGENPRKVKRQKQLSVKEKLLKEFGCFICRKVMVEPLTTPCAHNFCKACLEGAFSGQSFITERTCEGRRSLRAQKTIMKCPSCKLDISDFLKNPQVNRDLMELIKSLQSKLEEEDGDEGIDATAQINEVTGVDETGEATDIDGMDADCKDESDSSEEKVDALAVNKENCDANVGILEEVKVTNGDINPESIVKSPEKQVTKSPKKVKKKASGTLDSIVKSPEKQDMKSPKKGKKKASSTLDAGAKTPSKKARKA